MQSVSIGLAFGLVLALASPAAAVPETVSFTARVSDNGAPATGDLAIHIALFDAATGGTMVWEETQTLTADAGLVYATLGSTTALTPTVLDGRGLFAELTIEGDVLAPRIAITSVPYAIRAAVADSVTGFDPTALQVRVTGICGAGSSIRQVNADGTVVCQTGTGGDVTGVTAGAGLSGGGTSGDIALSVDTAMIQARVSGTCPAGSSIRTINVNGTVVCETGAVGDITGVAAGTGLSGGGASGDVALSVNTAVIQSRVTGACVAGSSIRTINADGTVVCQTDATGGVGTITGVGAGTGLSGGGTSGSVSLAIAPGGVGVTELATNAVTTAKIATGAVTMSKTDAPIGYAAAASPGSSFIYPSGSITFGETGSCFVAVQAYGAGLNTPFQVRPTMVHIASNIGVSQGEFGPSWFASQGATGGGYYGTATAVLAANQTGAWRIGCELTNGGTASINCRTSWICN